MTEPLVSVVVVPREGFRQAPDCLARLLVSTETPFRLVYVDGNAPARIARRVRGLVARHGGTLVRTNRFLRPTHARNLGFQRVDTRYTVFLDNDVRVTAGWLDALVSCAEETGAAFVSPVICIGARTPPEVHVAGGVNRIVEEAGRRRLIETYDHASRPLSEVLPGIARQSTTMAEFHAILIRTDSLKAMGGLDERCPTAFEHNDLCLSLEARGGAGWLEPTSIVDYVHDSPTAPGNLRYHLLRWSRAWIQESLDGLCDKWGLERDDPALASDLESLHGRRRKPLRHIRRVARRLGGEAAVTRVYALADRWVDGVARRHRNGHPPEPRVILYPGPRA